MTWKHLLEETARRSGLPAASAAQALNALFDLIIDKMETEDVIMLRPDFGCFEMRVAGGERTAHEQSLRKVRRTPVFKKSGALKKQLRQSDEAYLDMLRSSGRIAQANRLLRKREADRSI